MKRQTKKFIGWLLSASFFCLIITSCYHDDEPEIFDNLEKTEDVSTDEQNGNKKKPGS